MDGQFVFGMIAGFILAIIICAIIFIKFTQQIKVANERYAETKPQLSLQKSDGVWYIESVSSKGEIELQEVENEKVEEIIGDFIAGQIDVTTVDYNFDIRCSNGDEYSVQTMKKSVIDEKRTLFEQ